MLEDSITYKGREIRNLKVIGIAGMMTEAILHSNNRREVIEKYVGERDVNHLNADITREILLDITRKYERNCDIIPGAKAANLLRREDLQRGRCWACNEGGHETRECGRRDRLRYVRRMDMWQKYVCFSTGCATIVDARAVTVAHIRNYLSTIAFTNKIHTFTDPTKSFRVKKLLEALTKVVGTASQSLAKY